MDTYVFSELEFITLAAGKGMNRVYGFVMKEQDEADTGKIYQIIYRMVQLGYMEAVDDGFRLLPEISSLFQVIKDAKTALWIRQEDGEFPDRCCYIGFENCVITQLSSQDNHALKVSILPYGELERFLYEEGSFPDNCILETILEGKCEEKELSEVQEPAEGVQNCYEFVDIEKNQIIASVWIQDTGLEDKILVKEEKLRIWQYSKQKTVEEILRIADYCRETQKA